jgi:sugar O-acyltransferase (sialic acid O-acetyltransferase NeuD family)
MEKQKIVIFGDGDFAEQIKTKFDYDTEFEVVAFTVDEKFKTKETFLDLPVVAFEEIEKRFPPVEYKMFVAIGYTHINTLREEIFYRCKAKGYSFVTYISSKAVTWGHIEIGENSYIDDGVAIGSFCSIGKGVVILQNTVLAHNIVVNDFVFISLCAAIGGFVEIKKNTFIGINATVKDRLIIEEKVILGSGANLISFTNANSVYVGNPAKEIEKKSENTPI